MAMLDHWHPLYPSRQLKKGAVVAVALCNRNIALFRSETGNVGALDDICPHRRLKLSVGQVMGERLQCRYHGWTYDCTGNGESPGTPKLRACAGNYDLHEAQGMIWIKPRGVYAVFPAFDTPEMLPLGPMEHIVSAPLEVAVDNFCEIEHTGTVHRIFGYKLDGMRNVDVKFEATDSTVRVINVGPPKSMGWFIHLLMQINRRQVFIDDWTTHFSPVYSVYDHVWRNPQTKREAWVRWRLYMFFTPIDDNSIRVTTLAYLWSRYPYWMVRPWLWLLRNNLHDEIQLDAEVLKHMASYETSLEGMKLSRFDKALALNRERISRIYRGEPTPDEKIALRMAE